MTPPIEALEARLLADAENAGTFARRKLMRQAADALASQAATIRQMREALEKNASLLEVIAEDAKNRGDTATWSMASVMAEEVRAALNGGAK